MTTLFLVICFLAFLVWLGRLWRQRELKKFGDVDAQMLGELRQQHGVERHGEPTPNIQIKAPLTPEQLKPKAPVLNKEFESEPELKQQLYDKTSRSFMDLLQGQLAPRYRVLASVPLSSFVTTSQDLHLSFLVVSDQYEPVLGIEFFNAGFTEALALLKKLGLPVMRIEGDESAPSLRVKLKSLEPELVAGPVRETQSQAERCPKCSAGMTFKQPTAGKNAGKRYWLCSDYPKCRGVVPA